MIDNLERLIGAFANSLSKPIACHSGTAHLGYRFSKPGIPHFCLLKGIRAVSGLNAISELVKTGYSQEIVVILRTIVECTSHIEFVIIDFTSGSASEIKKYVSDYFDDHQRSSAADFKRPQVRQESVHRAVGSILDESMLSSRPDKSVDSVQANRLMSNIYLNYSNYVHARYPEVMDLYGGYRPRFHLSGMSGTPKDEENILMFEATVRSVSLCFKRMCIDLNLAKILESDDVLRSWFYST